MGTSLYDQRTTEMQRRRLPQPYPSPVPGAPQVNIQQGPMGGAGGPPVSPDSSYQPPGTQTVPSVSGAMPQPRPMAPQAPTTRTPTPAPAPTPAMPPAPVNRVTNTPGVSVNPIDPGADTRSSNILPAISGRQAGAQSLTDQTAGRVATANRPGAINSYADQFGGRLGIPSVGFNGVNPNVGFNEIDERINPSDSADLSTFRDQRLNAANEVSGGANRSAIARDRLAAFDLENQQGVQDLQRKIIQRSAGTGRLGMGDDQVASLRPFTDYMTQRAALSHSLAADTAEGEISDRLNTLSATRGLVGEEEGIGASRRGELRGERDFTRGERDTGLGVTERNFDRSAQERDAEMGLNERNVGRDFDARRTALELATGVSGQDRATDLASLDTLDRYGRGIGQDEAGYREEYRGERDYEGLLNRQAMEDAIRQEDREFGREGDMWNRDFAEDTLAAGLNPAGVYQGAATNYGAGGAGAYGAASDLFAQWLARQRRNTTGG